MSLLILGYYFLVLFINLTVMALSFLQVGRKMRVVSAGADLREEALEPVSILVPAFNEQATILDTVHSLLQQDYPEFEIIVINDGSKDDTLKLLREAYDLKTLESAWGDELPCGRIRQAFISETHRNVVVIDKENGGKADALNAGLNTARFPLVCCVDADGLLERDGLKRLACPFARDDRVVAAGGMVRPINGCEIQDGRIKAVHLPERLTERVQVAEYMRAFLSGRFGWERTNGLLIISGAFGMFRKAVLMDLGGYARTVGEDMELTLRLHHAMLDRKEPYRIAMAVDAVCWTQVPERLRDLRTQRVRWHRGLADALWRHRGMLLRPRYGMVGMAALPVFWFVEWMGPIIELTGYLIFLLLLITGHMTASALTLFLMAYLYGLVQSLMAVIAEDRLSRSYLDSGDGLRLVLICLIEPLLYRLLVTFWRCTALVPRKKRADWGSISRKGFS